MRLRNIVAAVVVAGAVLALLPAGAVALKRCSIGINIAPRFIEAGESAAAFGRFTCPGQSSNAVAGRSLKLWAHTQLDRRFHVVATTTTDARGFYAFVRPNLEFDTQLVVRGRGFVSRPRLLRVLAHVTISGPPDGAQLLTGAPNSVTFTGTVSPHDVGASVVLQRQNAGTGDDWRRIDQGTVGPQGTYSITHAFAAPGDANIRVLVLSGRRNAPSPSDVLSYEISQPQNPLLTINASANPIVFGQQVTISGSAPGAAHMPMTLLAHTAGQEAFAPVAEVKTDAAGNYVFAPQSPVSNTFYEVRGAGRLSTVLYEGVRDVITAAVTATNVRVGQSVTFFGAVSPAHTGHLIYLERQDRIGEEFHVVQVASVGAGSTYSITHTLFDPGTSVFRVKIPGGPENGGAASQTFTIQVTPAPAAVLRPEAPANSTLPSEGEH